MSYGLDIRVYSPGFRDRGRQETGKKVLGILSDITCFLYGAVFSNGKKE